MSSKLLSIRTLLRYNNLLKAERSTICTACSPIYFQKTQNRYYKNFGHKPQPEPKFTKFYCVFLLLGVLLPSLNFEWFSEKFTKKVDAFSGDIKEQASSDSLSETDDEEDNKKKKLKKKIGFRDRKVMA